VNASMTANAVNETNLDASSGWETIPDSRLVTVQCVRQCFSPTNPAQASWQKWQPSHSCFCGGLAVRHRKKSLETVPQVSPWHYPSRFHPRGARHRPVLLMIWLSHPAMLGTLSAGLGARSQATYSVSLRLKDSPVAGFVAIAAELSSSSLAQISRRTGVVMKVVNSAMI
jgi:hypothetical protein